jgi:hypothetical protein
MATSIEVDARDYQKFYSAIKSVDVDVQKALRKRITKVAKPIMNEIKEAARDLPSKNQGEREGVGLREGIAKSIQLKVNNSKKGGFSVRIRASGTKFNAVTGKYKKLPRYVEGMGTKPWRHPVFPDKGANGGSWQGAWVEQPATPFMLKTAMKHKAEVREEVAQAFLDALMKTKLVK